MFWVSPRKQYETQIYSRIPDEISYLPLRGKISSNARLSLKDKSALLAELNGYFARVQNNERFRAGLQKKLVVRTVASRGAAMDQAEVDFLNSYGHLPQNLQNGMRRLKPPTPLSNLEKRLRNLNRLPLALKYKD